MMTKTTSERRLRSGSPCWRDVHCAGVGARAESSAPPPGAQPGAPFHRALSSSAAHTQCTTEKGWPSVALRTPLGACGQRGGAVRTRSTRGTRPRCAAHALASRTRCLDTGRCCASARARSQCPVPMLSGSDRGVASGAAPRAPDPVLPHLPRNASRSHTDQATASTNENSRPVRIRFRAEKAWCVDEKVKPS